jgi:hypothetical protein
MNQLVAFDNMNLPAHLQGAVTDVNTDLSTGVTGGFAVLSIKGKVFHIVENKERTLIETPDTGHPAQSLDMVIVKANPAISKTYYPDGYSDDAAAKPSCYSNNGHHPELDSEAPQSKTCAACPMNVYGSRIGEGGQKGKACSDARRIAVAGLGDYGTAVLLRVPPTSLKALASYSDMLNKRRAPYQAVVTRISFDFSLAYPSLTFKAVDWLPADDYKEVLELSASSVVSQICAIDGHTGYDAGAEAADDDVLGKPPAHIAAAVVPPVPPVAPVAPVAAAQSAPAKPTIAAPARPASTPRAVVTPANPPAVPSRAASFGKPRAVPAAPHVEPAVTKAAPVAEASPVHQADVADNGAGAIDMDALMQEANGSLADALSALDD